jgi:hypothetical protein
VNGGQEAHLFGGEAAVFDKTCGNSALSLEA